MTADEFVSRMIDVFDFNLGSFGIVKPKSFSNAALVIANAAAGCCEKEANGFKFEIEQAVAFDYTVIQARMSDGHSEISANVCLYVDADSEPVPRLSSWSRVNTEAEPDSLLSMLTMLTLKTNNRLAA